MHVKFGAKFAREHSLFLLPSDEFFASLTYPLVQVLLGFLPILHLLFRHLPTTLP